MSIKGHDCSETDEHALVVTYHGDNCLSMECTICGTEFFYEGDEWV